jgi:uncharacterized membrane protein
MMVSTRSVVEEYLRELDRALYNLPVGRRREIVAEIREHIAEAGSMQGGEPTEAEMRTILDQVGEPETIAEEARQRFGITETRAGALEGLTLVFLLIGGIVIPMLGWIVGVVMLWVSRVWGTRDKVLGTLVLPGGLGLAVYFSLFAVGASGSCSMEVQEVRPGGGTRGGQAICSAETFFPDQFLSYLLLAFLVLAPIGMAIYLGRRAWRPKALG